ncbi:MAG: hypothetical protein QXQ82_02965 [Candidatus Pacearchaeota archaeon]
MEKKISEILREKIFYLALALTFAGIVMYASKKRQYAIDHPKAIKAYVIDKKEDIYTKAIEYCPWLMRLDEYLKKVEEINKINLESFSYDTLLFPIY